MLRPGEKDEGLPELLREGVDLKADGEGTRVHIHHAYTDSSLRPSASSKSRGEDTPPEYEKQRR